MSPGWAVNPLECVGSWLGTVLTPGFGAAYTSVLEVMRMARWLVILGIIVCLLLLLPGTAGGQRDFVAGGAIAVSGYPHGTIG